MESVSLEEEYYKQLYEICRVQSIQQLICPNNHPITKVCISPSCRSHDALHCLQHTCNSFSSHRNCTRNIQVSQLVSLIQSHRKDYRSFDVGMLDAQCKLLSSIRSSSLKIVKRRPSDDYQVMIDNLFKGGHVMISSHQASQLLNNIEQKSTIYPQPVKNILSKYAQTLNKLGSLLTQIKYYLGYRFSEEPYFSSQQMRSHIRESYVDALQVVLQKEYNLVKQQRFKDELQRLQLDSQQISGIQKNYATITGIYYENIAEELKKISQEQASRITHLIICLTVSHLSEAVYYKTDLDVILR